MNLFLPEGDQQATGGDERSTDVDGDGWGLVKANAGQELSHQEKEHDIDAQEAAKVER
jgi:hypothetical protein